jgi:hypothetical protein
MPQELCTKEAIWNHLRMVLMKVISTVENDTSALFTQENFDSMDFAHEILIGGGSDEAAGTR